MKIKGIVRGKVDRRFTLLKRERDRLRNISKGDILLLKINETILIRKILEDFIISLPRSLPLGTNSEIKIEILKHIKPSEGLKRPDRGFVGDIVDLKHFIPLKTIHGKDMFVIDDKDKIFVWFPHGGGVGHIHMRRFVDFETLFEIVGFLWGDGSTEGVRSIRFTNCEPSTLVHVLKFFETMGISRNKWKVQIIWSGPKEPSIEVKKNCKEFWSKSLDIPVSNIKSVLWSKSKSNKVKFGSARIFIDNAIFFEIFVNGILEWCKKEIKNTDANLDVLRSLLRGVAAAEASPFFSNEVVRGVEFSFDPNSEELNLFQTLLEKLNISCLEPNLKGRNCRFNVEGWNNLLKLFILDAFKLHKTKNKKFVEGFMKHKSTIFRFRSLKQIREGNLKGIRSESLKRFEKDKLIVIDKENITLTHLGNTFVNKLAKDHLFCYLSGFF